MCCTAPTWLNYVVKRSSAITVAAQLTDNWIEFPTLDKYSESSKD